MSSEGNLWGGNITAVDFLGALDEGMDLSALGIFNVRKYGAMGNGMHNDLAAINLAIADLNEAMYGGALYFPAGNYKIQGGAFTSPTKPCLIVGNGVSVTTITQWTAADGFFSFSGNTGVTIDGIYFTYNTAGTGGPAFTFTNITTLFVSNVVISSAYLSVLIDGGSGIFFRDVLIQESNSDCVKITGNANELHFTDCTFTGGDGNGLNLIACQGLYVTNCDLVELGGSCCLIRPVGEGDTSWVYNCFFEGVRFIEGAVFALYVAPDNDLAQTYQVKFDNCAFSGSADTGVRLWPIAGTITSYNFSNCSMYLNDGYGVVIDSGVSHVQFANCQMDNNSISDSGFSGGGVWLGGTCSDILITGCDIGTTPESAYPQPYGVGVASTVTNLQVTGCDLNGNTKAPVYAISSPFDPTVRFSANAGYNPVGEITVTGWGATSFSYINQTGVDLMFYVTGGTVTSISIDGDTTNLKSGSFFVAVGSTIDFVYTVKPTAVVFGN
jgi:Pectate lyase superfamily protein